MTQSAFSYVDDVLHAEGVSAASLAEQFGTPLYVYSRSALTEAYHAYADACDGRRAKIHVAVKANSNLAVLNVFARLGAGFDIVSGANWRACWPRAAKRKTRCFRASARPRPRCARRSTRASNASTSNRFPNLHRAQRSGEGCGQESAGVAAREPRRRCENASVYFHRPQVEQVRRGVRRCARNLSRRPARCRIST